MTDKEKATSHEYYPKSPLEPQLGARWQRELAQVALIDAHSDPTIDTTAAIAALHSTEVALNGSSPRDESRSRLSTIETYMYKPPAPVKVG